MYEVYIIITAISHRFCYENVTIKINIINNV